MSIVKDARTGRSAAQLPTIRTPEGLKNAAATDKPGRRRRQPMLVERRPSTSPE